MHKQERLTSAENAYRILRKKIIRLELEPNTVVSETKLAELLSVSRTPIREALARLATDGLVDFKSRSITLVAPIRIEFFLAAQFIREKLEVAIIEEVANIDDPKFMFKFKQMLEEQKFAIETGDTALFFECDELMHESFSVAAGKPQVWAAAAGFKKHMDRVRWLNIKNTDLNVLLHEHQQIFDAVKARDAGAATTVMECHLRKLVGQMERLKSQYGDYFASPNS